MLKSTIAVLATTLFLVGCASGPESTSLAALRAACNAGDRQSCVAGGFHAQQKIDDAAIAASLDAALSDAIRQGTRTAALNHQRYSSIQ